MPQQAPEDLSTRLADVAKHLFERKEALEETLRHQRKVERLESERKEVAKEVMCAREKATRLKVEASKAAESLSEARHGQQVLERSGVATIERRLREVMKSLDEAGYLSPAKRAKLEARAGDLGDELDEVGKEFDDLKLMKTSKSKELETGMGRLRELKAEKKVLLHSRNTADSTGRFNGSKASAETDGSGQGERRRGSSYIQGARWNGKEVRGWVIVQAKEAEKKLRKVVEELEAARDSKKRIEEEVERLSVHAAGGDADCRPLEVLRTELKALTQSWTIDGKG